MPSIAACSALPLLHTAMERETVLEGRAVCCTPDHDLTVSLGPFTGRIPREEAALGIREGTARGPQKFLVGEGDALLRPVPAGEDGKDLLSRREAAGGMVDAGDGTALD